MSIFSERKRGVCCRSAQEVFSRISRTAQWLLHNEIALVAVCCALPDQTDVDSSIIIVIVIVIVSSAGDVNMIFEIFTQPSSEGPLGHKSVSKLID